jgi:hypothetical protein
MRSLLNELTAERDYIDRAIEALRPLVLEETNVAAQVEHVEKLLVMENGYPHAQTNGNGTNGSANGHANGASPELSPTLEHIMKVLRERGEPMRVSEIQKALGRNAPRGKTDIFRFLDKAKKLGVKRSGSRGTFRYSIPAIQ